MTTTRRNSHQRATALQQCVSQHAPALHRRHHLVPLLALLVLPLLTIGCHQSQLARDRLADRRSSTQDAIRLWSSADADRPTHLANADRFIREDLDNRAQYLKHDMAELDEWYQRDVEYMPARQQRYRDQLRQIFGGRTDNIEPIAIMMFY